MGLLVGLGPAYAGGGNGGNTGGGEGGAPLAVYSMGSGLANAASGSIEIQYGTSLKRLFQSNKTLIKVGLFDTSKVTDFSEMFDTCSTLSEIPAFDYSQADTLDGFADNAAKLAIVPPMYLPKCRILTYAFNLCGSIVSLEIAAPNVTTLFGTFWRCRAMKSIKISFGQGITAMRNAFSTCQVLKTIDGVLDIPNCNDMDGTFDACAALENVKIKNLATSVSFEACPVLSKSDVLYMFENAKTVEASETITLHADVFGQLSAEEIAVATGKGFSVVSA